MTSSSIGDILALISDAVQLLAALVAIITAGLVAGRRARAAAGDRPHPSKTRQKSSKHTRGTRSSAIENSPEIPDTSPK